MAGFVEQLAEFFVVLLVLLVVGDDPFGEVSSLVRVTDPGLEFLPTGVVLVEAASGDGDLGFHVGPIAEAFLVCRSDGASLFLGFLGDGLGEISSREQVGRQPVHGFRGARHRDHHG